MDQNDFIYICSDEKFWQWIRNKSIVPYDNVNDKKTFLKELFVKVSNRTYYPSPPKEYLTINKGHGVLRVVPVFNLSDLVIYYYCTRKLETYIALNHVSGTYGGFGLRGKLRRTEEDKVKKISDNLEKVEFDGNIYVFQELAGYPVHSSFNPKAWQAEWGDFTDKLYHHSFDFEDGIEGGNGIVAELDISNFYDSIQLDNLEFKIRKYISNEENKVVYLLMHFLRFWNRHINFYRQQGAGVPQDLFGECSRILANFYLQDYDENFSNYCENKGGRYFRYADDQVIFAKTSNDLEKLIGKASSLLMKDGLNFNQKKIKVVNIDEFREYYAFDNFLKLASNKDKTPKISIVEEQIDFYLRNGLKLRKGGVSLLKRILNIIKKYKISPSNFRTLKGTILNHDFFQNTPLYSSDWKTIYDLLDDRERNSLINIFNHLVEECLYSYFLFDVKQFYVKIKQPTGSIDARLEELKKFYEWRSF